MSPTPAAVQLRYTVRTVPEEWVLTEGTVPESVLHDTEAEHLKMVLQAWASQSPRKVRIARNLAVRWLEEDPRIGIDPDVCVLEPPPPHFEEARSLRLWLPGHLPPKLCFEIVSEKHPHKDYTAIQDRYAAIRTDELIVFDPLLAGPRSLGGPVPLQRWVRDGELFERVFFGDGPIYSTVLDAWVMARERRLVIADDRAGMQPWLTGEERERAQRIDLERRVAELEGKHGRSIR